MKAVFIFIFSLLVSTFCIAQEGGGKSDVPKHEKSFKSNVSKLRQIEKLLEKNEKKKKLSRKKFANIINEFKQKKFVKG